MVLLLIADIIDNGIHVTIADAERTITILPAKWVQRTVLRINPFRRTGFHHTDGIRQRHRPILQVEDVDMVGRTSNAHSWTFQLIQDARNIRVHIRQPLLWKRMGSILSREHQMRIYLR